jgi:acetyltransferase-like isoleucine patch superfamily enzyme
VRGLRDRLGDVRARVRFAVWARRLRRALRAHGAELELDAPHGALLAAPPLIELGEWGRAGGARTVLRLGAGVRLGRDVVLELFPGGTNVIELGDRTIVDDHVRLQVRDGAIRLGPDARLRSHAILKADGEIVGEGRNEFSYFSIVHCAGRVELGHGAGIADRVSVVDSDHPHDGSDTYFYDHPIQVDPVVLERNVFVAASAVITRGTRIGRNSVVAAGAVVTGGRSYPPASLIAGVPARVVRTLGAERQPVSSAQ